MIRRLGDWSRGWWRRRTLAFRVTAVVGTLMIAGFGVLAVVAVRAVDTGLTDTVDAELHAAVRGATPLVGAGRSVPFDGDPQVRVLDTAGQPTDGGPRLGFGRSDVRGLLAGSGVFTEVGGTSWRWVGEVVTVPDGSRRLVVAGTDLIGQVTMLRRAAWVIGLSAAVFSLAVAAATWLAVRLALLPVRRLRQAAALLPEGQRLPVPAAADELRGLATALNELLARRDESAEKLRRFTGDAAHELRSPVASIRAQAEVAVAHPDPELSAETLADIVAESQRLTDLLSDLLALARADAGERQSARDVDLAAVARAAAARAAARVSGDGRTAAVEVRVVAPAEVVVLAAAADVDRVLDNLLGNAVRHATALVRISVLPHARGARIWVDDDGPGVPPEHRELVFHRFHRVSTDRSRDGGGAGLGLALVAETVRRYGGTVAVTDSPEGGARFEVRWPMGSAEPDAATRPPATNGDDVTSPPFYWGNSTSSPR
ncbi:MAG TPA: HAMP domain-containing sensor histidine kinase [Pseudonocardiaceae bacterium]|jgi:signal transduction histidine kinase